MKKLIYFLPAIILLIIVAVTCVSDVLYITDYTNLILNFAVMVLSGVHMYKGKIWGAVFGALFFAVWGLVDYICYLNTPVDLMHQQLPAIWFIWPVILFYLICAVVIAYKKIKNRK